MLQYERMNEKVLSPLAQWEKMPLFLSFIDPQCLGQKEIWQMEVYQKNITKSIKLDQPIQGAPFSSHLKYAIFEHFGPFFAHCANIFDSKVLKL